MRFPISPASESRRNAMPTSDGNEKDRGGARRREVCSKERKGKVQKKKSTAKRRRRRVAETSALTLGFDARP